MDSSSQTALAFGAASLVALATFLLYAAPILFFGSSGWMSSVALIAVPAVSFLICMGFLYLAQLPVDSKDRAPISTIAKNSQYALYGTSIFVAAPFLLPFLRGMITSAVPGVYSLTPEQLIVESKSRSQEELQVFVDQTTSKQSVFEDGLSFSYFSFWGTLFGTMLALTFT